MNATDSQGRIPVGTLYLAPNGDAYRLRSYGVDWEVEPFTGERTMPDYGVALAGGMNSTARELPEGCVIIWTPVLLEVGDRVTHSTHAIDDTIVYGHVVDRNDDEQMTQVTWADGSGPTWQRTATLRQVEARGEVDTPARAIERDAAVRALIERQAYVDHDAFVGAVLYDIYDFTEPRSDDDEGMPPSLVDVAYEDLPRAPFYGGRDEDGL